MAAHAPLAVASGAAGLSPASPPCGLPTRVQEDEMVAKIGSNRSVDTARFFCEHNVIELFDHLATREEAQVAPPDAGGALRVFACHRSKLLRVAADLCFPLGHLLKRRIVKAFQKKMRSARYPPVGETLPAPLHCIENAHPNRGSRQAPLHMKQASVGSWQQAGSRHRNRRHGQAGSHGNGGEEHQAASRRPASSGPHTTLWEYARCINCT